MTNAISTVRETLRIENKLGLHARAAAKFVQVASKFESEIQVEKGGVRVDGKSIMGVLMLAAAQGTSIVIIATGGDARAAADALSKLVSDKFGEDQ